MIILEPLAHCSCQNRKKGLEIVPKSWVHSLTPVCHESVIKSYLKYYTRNHGGICWKSKERLNLPYRPTGHINLSRACGLHHMRQLRIKSANLQSYKEQLMTRKSKLYVFYYNGCFLLILNHDRCHIGRLRQKKKI